MKEFFLLFFTLLFFGGFVGEVWGQPWTYNFGTETGTYNTNNSASTTFLPTPESNGGTARVKISNGQGGAFILSNPGVDIGGSGSQLQISAPTGTSVNKFSIYDYSAGKSFTLRFRLRLGASDGSATGAASGTWFFFIGDGATYSDNNGFSGSQVFTGLQLVFGDSGAITTNYRNGGSWSAFLELPFLKE